MEENVIIADPEVVNDFIVEAGDILENTELALLALEQEPADIDQINTIFRGYHTIKGISGFLGFTQLEQLAHQAEDVLQLLRNSALHATPTTIDLLLEAQDVIKSLVNKIKNEDNEPVEVSGISEKLSQLKSTTNNKQTSTLSQSASAMQSQKGIEGSKQEPLIEMVPTDNEQKSNTEQNSTPPEAQNYKAKTNHNSIKEYDSIRVPIPRIDDLMDLVGELVIERNRLLDIKKECSSFAGLSPNLYDRLINVVEQIDFITSSLQMAGLSIRMMPIGQIFKKLPRLVRSVAAELGKEVELKVTGADTEVDKTVVDHLSEPLVHLIRNAIDHGIENPAERVKAKKDSTGTVRVHASQEGHYFVMRVEDDGKGIDPERIRLKAIDKGILPADQAAGLSNRELLNLVFQPGLSTASKVNKVSGRGVGMDVVKTNIIKLNGIIQLNSRVGIGTEVILRMPLTLATMQTLLVKVHNEIAALPLFSVLETFSTDAKEIVTVNQKEVIRHRDSIMPLLRLERFFPHLSPHTTNDQKRYVIVVGSAEGRVGLIVDDLLHQEEVVVKSLGSYLGSVAGIAGATIAGNGQVRLIIDTSQLIEMEQRRIIEVSS